MAFLETPRFPDDIALDALEGGPTYSTSVLATFGGTDFRNINRAQQKGEWDTASGIRTPGDFNAVRDLFRMARGQAHGFRFRDWADYLCTHDEGVLTLVSGSLYQMYKRYGSGATLEDRIITKPIAATCVFKRNRGGTITTITPTLDATTGGVIVSSHVGGDVYTWAGEFDVPVRFNTDQLRTRATGPRDYGDGRPLLSWDAVPLIEDPQPGASA
jgi:uncharacterized protein (TIGR02217 family)